MSDRELLELAAKAADLALLQVPNANYTDAAWWAYARDAKPNTAKPWNPLTDDGDALRLAVKLRLVIDADLGEVLCPHEPARGVHYAGPTNTESIRRAIVRAAAEIGRQQ